MNKRASEFLSLYWFVILVIITTAVVSGVLLFYSGHSDVRAMEAEILASKLSDCFIQGGILNGKILSENFDILQECKITFNDENTEYGGEVQYYIKITILDFSTSNILKEYDAGRKDFYEKCVYQKEKGTEENFPQCYEKTVYAINDAKSGKYLIKILTSVRKTEQNV